MKTRKKQTQFNGDAQIEFRVLDDGVITKTDNTDELDAIVPYGEAAHDDIRKCADYIARHTGDEISDFLEHIWEKKGELKGELNGSGRMTITVSLEADGNK